MATSKRDTVAAATEAPTGVNRVKFANKTESAVVSSETEAEFVKPLYIQEKSMVRAFISIYDNTGLKLKTFDRVVITQLNGSESDRVARTAIADGEHLRYLGRAPRQLTFTAAFYNTANYPWLDEFMVTWDKWLRGSALQEKNAYAYLKIDERIYKGTFTGYQYAQTGENNTVVVGSIVMDIKDVIVGEYSSLPASVQSSSVIKELYSVTKEKI